MALPNLLIVGAQKCGTTWLHLCLKKSRHVFGSTPKELNFFNTGGYLARRAEYEAAFAEAGNARWRLESTPHYFRLPEGGKDIAARIHHLLGGDVRLLVMLRDPVERYLSAYTHHMMKGRFVYVPVIDHFSDDYRMLALGDYASILAHWKRLFPDIGVFLYDDLLVDQQGLISRVMAFLDTENDLSASDAEFVTNAKSRKVKRVDTIRDWPSLPELSPDLRTRLAVRYRAETCGLADMIGRDLSHWAPLRPEGS